MRVSKRLREYFTIPTLISLSLTYSKLIKIVKTINLLPNKFLYSVRDASGNKIYINTPRLNQFFIKLKVKSKDKAVTILS